MTTSNSNSGQGNSNNKPGNMRDAMPSIAAWIDNLRDIFGADTINPMLREMYASENGHEIGKKAPLYRAVAVSDMPDIVALMEGNKAARNAYKPIGNKRHR